MTNTLAANGRYGQGNVAGTPLVNITAAPQQLPIASHGSTLVNTSSVPIILATDAIANASNSFMLAANGASLPIPTGPLWASIEGATTPLGSANLLVIPGMFNVFNPNVLAQIPPTTHIFNTTVTLPNNALTPLNYGLSAGFPNGIISIGVNTHTLVIRIPLIGNQPLAVLTVTGSDSGYVYYNNPFYLPATGPNLDGIAVVPVNPGIDTGVIVTTVGLWAAVAGQITPLFIGDSATYEESIFYNGTIKAIIGTQSGVGFSTVLTGPARLLTATLFSNLNTVPINLNIDNQTILSAGGFSNTTMPVGFPPNTILKAGSVITITASGTTNAFGEVGYAYP